MKILVIGDFHGKFPEKLKRRIKNENVDLILSTGDYADTYILRNLEFKYWDKLKNGFSFSRILGKKKYKILLRNAINSINLILKKLKSLNKPIISIYGNSDITNKEAKKYSLRGIETLSKHYNICLLKSNITKFKGIIIAGISGYRGASCKGLTKIEYKIKPKIKTINFNWNSKLSKIFKKDKNVNEWIFIAHDVPLRYFDKVKFKQSPMYGKYVGDEYLTKYIKKYQPKLFICGHMHEYQGIKNLGKTRIITTGAAQDGKAVIINLDEQKGKVKNIRFLR